MTAIEAEKVRLLVHKGVGTTNVCLFSVGTVQTVSA